MCGIAGYSLSPPTRASIGHSPRRHCWPAIAERGTDAVGYAYAAPAEHDAPLVVVKQRTPASKLLERVSRPGTRERAARARARLHQRAPVDRGQQPSGPARPGRRRPQRADRERRRAARRVRLRARRAEHDRRLRGGLRRRRALPTATPRAFEALRRLDGGRLARRARSPSVPVPRPRRRPAALARRVDGTASSSPRPRTRSRSLERYCG